MQLVMPFARDISYAPEDFIRGEANAQALDIMLRWPDWPYSILLLHGPQGSGKTHLAHVFAKRSHATFIDPARLGNVPADQLLVGNHCWVLDDMEAVADEAALAQLINHARARGDYVLLTAQRSAAEQQIPLPDLRSRLLALPAIALLAPDDALLMGVIAKEFADRQLRVSPELLHYVAQRLDRSYTAIHAFVKAVDRVSLSRGRAVTVPLVRELCNNDHWQNL